MGDAEPNQLRICVRKWIRKMLKSLFLFLWSFLVSIFVVAHTHIHTHTHSLTLTHTYNHKHSFAALLNIGTKGSAELIKSWMLGYSSGSFQDDWFAYVFLLLTTAVAVAQVHFLKRCASSFDQGMLVVHSWSLFSDARASHRLSFVVSWFSSHQSVGGVSVLLLCTMLQ